MLRSRTLNRQKWGRGNAQHGGFPIIMSLRSWLPLKPLLIAALLLPSAGPVWGAGKFVRLTGSGASFPFPIYSVWFKNFSRNHRDVIVDYQAKGSGAGIRDFINGTVDFAGSDAAITPDEAAQVGPGVQIIPATAGKIVLSYNLPMLNKPLRLSRDAYAAIFLGEIDRWDDPRIRATNPEARLPDMNITVVRRADSSGTTYAFTNHLSAISETWRNRHGVGKTVVWSNSNRFIAAPKNDGVAATVKQTPGSIGFIEYGFAKFAGVAMAYLENRQGNFVAPTPESGQAALASEPMPPHMLLWLPDPAGPDSYPIVTYSWLLFYRRYDDPAMTRTIHSLLEYCLTEGQAMAAELGYIPLPDEAVSAVRTAMENIR
jgi:phosphate transport system substrate-binding protein